jgi:hypothetical protein
MRSEGSVIIMGISAMGKSRVWLTGAAAFFRGPQENKTATKAVIIRVFLAFITYKITLFF